MMRSGSQLRPRAWGWKQSSRGSTFEPLPINRAAASKRPPVAFDTSFCETTAERHSISRVATAHTADDVVETVLHHLLRGTSLDGLRGIARRRRLSPDVTLLRPLLDVRRSEIESFLESLGQTFLTDATNADVSFTRNRLRHEVLPMLRNAVNPQVDDALLRLAQQAAEASALVKRLARRVLAASADRVISRDDSTRRETTQKAAARAGPGCDRDRLAAAGLASSGDVVCALERTGDNRDCRGSADLAGWHGCAASPG